MVLRVVFLSILIIHISASRRSHSYHDDDEYRHIKRFFFHHDTTSTNPPSVIGNLVRPSTSIPPYIWPARTTTNSPWYPSGACASHNCEHGGICVPKTQSTYECKCVGPWRGLYCNYADACAKSLCRNGGSCVNVLDDYWCKCTNDYYGQNCETRFSNSGNFDGNNNNANCRPGICNTGECVPLQTTYYCRCPDNRHGSNCEKTISYYKRDFSKRRTLDQVLKQIKRDVNEENDSNESDLEERAMYDNSFED